MPDVTGTGDAIGSNDHQHGARSQYGNARPSARLPQSAPNHEVVPPARHEPSLSQATCFRGFLQACPEVAAFSFSAAD